MKQAPDFSNRNLEIGGSEIAAIMNMHPYETPLSLWAKKTGKLPPNDLSNFEAAEIGTELEEYVSRKFTRKTGIKLRVDNRTFKHPKYPYMIGHIDRWVVGEDAVFEAKTASAWLEKKWKGEDIPENYVLQLMWYLGLVGKRIGHIAVLIGGQKFVYKQIEFDQELFDRMVEAARHFMEEHILKDVAPMAEFGDSETLLNMFPDSIPLQAELSEETQQELDVLLDDRRGALESQKHLKEELGKTEARIKQIIGENESAETDKYRVFWKPVKKESYVVEPQYYRQLRQKEKK